jgi:hypothetical protein
MAKYKTLKELSDAFKAGELKDWKLMLDNDCTHLTYFGPAPSGVDSEDFEEEMYDKGKELYNGNDDVYILDQALTLAGIPNEGV